MATLTANRSRIATKIVDCDSHIVPRVDLDSLGDLLPQGLTAQARDMYAREARMWAEPGAGRGRTESTGPVPLRDPEVRLKVLDDDLGVDMQVLIPHGQFGHLYGGTPEGEDKPLPTRIAVVKAYNNAVAAIQRQFPDRYIATALLPFDDLEESRQEARRAVTELGIGAIQLPANWMGHNFDAMELYPFWDTINEMDVPIFVHHIPQSCAGSLVDHVPRYPIVGQDRMRRLHIGVYIGFGIEYAVCVAALSLGGVLDEFPNLRFCFFESGAGWLPYAAMGADRSFYIQNACSRTRTPPSQLIRKHCFTAVEFSQHIPALVQMYGSENFFFGTDYPHGEWVHLPNDVQTYVNADLSAMDRENILGRTMLRVLHRE
jgi:predicted TIM-barrel fold metal-dependent hydrolase